MATPVRLVIADDSEVIRRAIRELLHAQTDITISGEACLYADLLKMLRVLAADVVLLDIRMPDEGRFDPATIKVQLNGSCLLAMSFWRDEETASLAQNYGALKLLDKSELASTLIPAIEECIQQKLGAPHA
jgi:two-component system invasion response regulator UvrY